MKDRRLEFENMLKFAAGRRKGFDDFMEWLNDTDFFTAPASTRYHGASEGMLLCHSLNVCERLLRRTEEAKEKGISMESMILVALLHDVCKIDRYIPKRDEEGNITGYEYNKAVELPVGHGERSVILIQQQGLTLTLEEIIAIRWHMGAYDDAARGNIRALDEAFKGHPLAVMLHLADMEATWLYEQEEGK